MKRLLKTLLEVIKILIKYTVLAVILVLIGEYVPILFIPIGIIVLVILFIEIYENEEENQC